MKEIDKPIVRKFFGDTEDISVNETKDSRIYNRGLRTMVISKVPIPVKEYVKSSFAHVVERKNRAMYVLEILQY